MRDEADRRRNVVAATPAAATLERLDARVAAAQEAFLAPLDAAERAQLSALLARVIDHHRGCALAEGDRPRPGAADGRLVRGAPELCCCTGFPRRPRMEPGDRLVYYASVWRAVFAVVEVVSEPEQTRPGTRWPWTVDVEPLLAIPLLTTRRRSRRSACPRAR